jgi:hypothetical protein
MNKIYLCCSINNQLNQNKMSTETKLPHHLSKLYKQMANEGLINDQKEYVGEIPLDEYLKSFETAPDAIEEKAPIVAEEKEPTIPLSQVSEMLDKMVAEKLKGISFAQPQQPQYQPPLVKEEYDIEDLPEFKNWEVRDREYEYLDGKPVSASIPSKHTDLVPLQYFNKVKNKVHILRYASNQPSFFQENQSKEPGSVVLAEILFKFGRLKVPANEINLQKFLHIHPYKDKIFTEYDPKAKSREIVAKEKLNLKALGLVFGVGEITNRAIASVECPNYVDSWSTELLEEEVLAIAKKDPAKYIAYTEDPTIKIKGVVKGAMATGELIYSTYRWMNKNREVILEVAKNHDEIEEIVKYFESGVGRTFYEFLLHSK